MYIDKSHSKKDLILLFNDLGIELNDEVVKRSPNVTVNALK